MFDGLLKNIRIGLLVALCFTVWFIIGLLIGGATAMAIHPILGIIIFILYVVISISVVATIENNCVF